MKSYYLNSIDIKNCNRTNEETLKRLKKCVNCTKIALPPYKSWKNQKNHYCKDCYLKIDPNLETLIYLDDLELEIIEKIIINCDICNLEFDLNSLNLLEIHKENCQIKSEIIYLPCKRCHSFPMFEPHDCISQLSNDI